MANIKFASVAPIVSHGREEESLPPRAVEARLCDPVYCSPNFVEPQEPEPTRRLWPSARTHNGGGDLIEAGFDYATLFQ